MKQKRNLPAGKLLLFSCILLICTVLLSATYLFLPKNTHTQRVQVPDFCGQMYGENEFPSWITVRVEYRHDKDAPGGRILSQDPAGGSFRKLSDERPICHLTLVVSLGQEQILLPNMAGKEHRLAEQELRSLGLSVKTVHGYGPYSPGSVWQTDPMPGALLPKGATVTLYVCDGIEEKSLPVPDLMGLSRSDALVALWMSGFSVAGIYEVPVLEEQRDTVIEQSHLPGTLLPSGTGIYIWIGSTE